MQSSNPFSHSLSRSASSRVAKAVSYIILSLLGITTLLPFMWMLFGTFKTAAEVMQPTFLPQHIQWENYKEVLATSNLADWYKNSLIVAILSTISVVFFDSLAGYTFAKFEFPLKKLFFIIILSTLMIPTEMLIIPWYVMAAKVGWVNTYWGIVFPGLISAGGVFLMQQFMRGVPDELIDSARIDGMNEFQIFWTIAVPLSGPAIGALAIFNFLGNWNAFLWPLIVSSDRSMMTLPVGMLFFSNEAGSAWEMVMTGATFSVLPLMIIFLFFQRYIVQGITITGLKG